jgi:hypothetical protein
MFSLNFIANLVSPQSPFEFGALGVTPAPIFLALNGVDPFSLRIRSLLAHLSIRVATFNAVTIGYDNHNGVAKLYCKHSGDLDLHLEPCGLVFLYLATRVYTTV